MTTLTSLVRVRRAASAAHVSPITVPNTGGATPAQVQNLLAAQARSSRQAQIITSTVSFAAAAEWAAIFNFYLLPWWKRRKAGSLAAG
ncbi:hypothetical protein [Streptomyces sp. RPT161]|uniref:hypothetical protein n=1 Tax=Streptomyces sp. RPT161 TaxID=3015993 RepID=UPI0022B8902F|nr:hypothetical protein [Streptomyces sp. RPT161]